MLSGKRCDPLHFKQGEKTMRKLMLTVALATSLVGCPDYECENSSECGSIRECVAHECELKPGYCESDSNCASSQECRSNMCRAKAPDGYPPGTVMLACGCNGPASPGYAPESRCASGQVVLRVCVPNYYCPGGGLAWGATCR